MRSAYPRVVLHLLVAALAIVILPLGPETASAQSIKERVEIPTDDSVMLVGDWYPSGKGKNGPVVVLCHAIGPGKEGAKRQDWEKLPELLQKEGYHVLTFDFRGYGDSTRLIEKLRYWTTPGRLTPAGFRANNPPATISSRDWRSDAHLLWLGNDLLAVKKWLNIKNNAEECNSANICLICAEQTGVLAELFLYNEYCDPNRDKANDWSKPMLPAQRNPSKWEGEDYTHLILLSMPDRLGTRVYRNLLRERMIALTRKRAFDTLTIYGADDTQIKNFWNDAIKWIKPEAELKELEKTGRYEVPKTKLAGTNLVTNEALGVDKVIVDYLNKFMSKSKPWKRTPEKEGAILFNIQLAVQSPAPPIQ
ncbi:MAG: alpha/beta hydrolase [Gemmatales bacterium]|nr:alpha/beta hydrolase [Gemmatales bacterium]MDW8386077.1 alpha/beta fold hydrolase [Gemmatales bacterium]